MFEKVCLLGAIKTQVNNIIADIADDHQSIYRCIKISRSLKVHWLNTNNNMLMAIVTLGFIILLFS